jgi:hypothetical protein
MPTTTPKPSDLVDVGRLYRGFTWQYAINNALTIFRAPIRPIYKFTNPSSLFDDRKEFSHYELCIKDKGRTLTTRIPASLNDFVCAALSTKAA